MRSCGRVFVIPPGVQPNGFRSNAPYKSALSGGKQESTASAAALPMVVLLSGVIQGARGVPQHPMLRIVHPEPLPRRGNLQTSAVWHAATAPQVSQERVWVDNRE